MKYSKEEKRMWLEDWKINGIELMVCKRMFVCKGKQVKSVNNIHKGSKDTRVFCALSSGILQRLYNIISFKIGIIREKFFNCLSGSDLPYNHTHSNPHTANTGFATHNSRILGYSV